jgi:hypothetical protein
MSAQTKACDGDCRGTAHWSKNCGAYVCQTCGTHVGLARCYCGWSSTGGDGRIELIDMGENLEGDE